MSPVDGPARPPTELASVAARLVSLRFAAFIVLAPAVPLGILALLAGDLLDLDRTAHIALAAAATVLGAAIGTVLARRLHRQGRLIALLSTPERSPDLDVAANLDALHGTDSATTLRALVHLEHLGPRAGRARTAVTEFVHAATPAIAAQARRTLAAIDGGRAEAP